MVTPLAKTAAAVLFAAPVALLSACAPPGQVPSTTSGTNPPIWTGSPGPSAPGATASPCRAETTARRARIARSASNQWRIVSFNTR